MFRRTCLLTAVLLVAVLAPGARGEETDIGDTTARLGLHPAALEKTEEGTFAAGLADGRLPGVSLEQLGSAPGEGTRLAESAAAAAGAAAGAAGAQACLPYSVRSQVEIVDDLDNLVFREDLRIQLQWCPDGFRDVAPGEGTCTATPWWPYRPGVSRCWWSKGLWGGAGFSFQTGATYHVRAAVGAVHAPVDHATIELSYGGVWWGPGSDVQRTGDCFNPAGLPPTWRVSACPVYRTSDW